MSIGEIIAAIAVTSSILSGVFIYVFKQGRLQQAVNDIRDNHLPHIHDLLKEIKADFDGRHEVCVDHGERISRLEGHHEVVDEE